MFARVSRFSRQPGSDAGLEDLRTRLLPALREIDGFRGVLSLHDGAGGHSLAVTFWADEAFMVASRSAADAMRRSGAEERGESIVDVAEYEVALLELEE